MSLCTQSLFLTMCLISSLNGSASSDQPAEKGKESPNKNEPARAKPPDAELVNKLIQQLGSSRYPEREAARKQLEAIGEPALDALRKAAKSSPDIETRRRVEQLVDRLELKILDKLVKDGVHQHMTKDYKKAAELFDRAIREGLRKFGPKNGKAPEGEVPFLTEVLLPSAQATRELGDFEKASKDYQGASYYANHNQEKRRQIDAEWAEMVAHLLAGWRDTVKPKTDNDPALKKLVSKHPLVLLHSRRYAGGGYLQSAHSFLYETTVERKHYNDVQLLFDNGLRNTFDLNMVVGQKNRVADLGTVDFEKSPDLKKIKADDKIQWQSDVCKAIEGHVYLGNVRDDSGNNFFVLFQVVAVEKDSKYVAFVWRRLPGGKVVKQR
jgi:tetratricopeptide (TPR) repeat protein